MKNLAIGFCLSAFWIFFFEVISDLNNRVAHFLFGLSVVLYFLYALSSMACDEIGLDFKGSTKNHLPKDDNDEDKDEDKPDHS